MRGAPRVSFPLLAFTGWVESVGAPVSPSATEATGAGAANTATSTVAPAVTAAASAGTANDATVTRAGNPAAAVAAGAGASNAPQPSTATNLTYGPTVAYGSASTASALAAASTGVTIPKPAQLTTGDVMFAFISKTTYADTNPFTCSGWTDITSSGTWGTTTENDRHLTILRKVVTDAPAEAATYTFVTTSGTTSGMAGVIVRVTGASTSTPEDLSLGNTTRTFAVNDSTPASQDVNTVTDGALVLQYCLLAIAATSTYTWGAPSGYTQDAAAQVNETTTASSDQQAGVAYKTQTTAGAVGSNAWTHSPNDGNADTVVAAVVVRPAVTVAYNAGSGAGAANNATVTRTGNANADAAAGAGAANDATVTVGTTAPAAAATSAGAANGPTGNVSTSSGSSAGSGAGNAATGSLLITAGAGTGSGAANNATVSTASATNASAAAATGAGAANTATGAISTASGSSAGSGAGNAATGSISIGVGHAAGTGTANDATVTTSVPTNADAATATGAGAAHGATGNVSPTAGTSGAGAANQATGTLTTAASAAVSVGAALNPTVIGLAPDPDALTISIRDHGHTVTLYHRR